MALSELRQRCAIPCDSREWKGRDVLHLLRLGTFVPTTRTSVVELRDELGLSEAQTRLYVRYLGLDRIAVATGMGLADMLVAAAEPVLRGQDRDSVRYLIHAHTIHLAPPRHDTLLRVRTALGLTTAAAFSVSHLNCVAGLHALQLARYLLADRGDPAATALVIAGEKVVSPRLRIIENTTIMGEAAAACLVGAGPGGDRVLGHAVRTMGQFYEGEDGPRTLRREYQRCYVDQLAEVIGRALHRAGRTVADLAAVLPHNVNRLSWVQVAQRAGIALHRVYLDTLADLGHCFCADPFLNLASARAADRVRPGDVVLLATAGLGATFSATVLRLGEVSP